MKTFKSMFMPALLGLLCFSSIFHELNAQSAIYAGGPMYYGRDYAIDELRASGFTTVIVWTIHIQANGDLTFNGEFPLVESGVYVGNSQYPNFPGDIAQLKTAPTSITRVEFGLSAAGSGTFDAVRDFYNSEGFGPGTTLYENFAALKAAIPAVDALNNDDESTYHVASAVAFTKMLAGLGFKNAIVPYQNSSFWSALVSQVNAEFPGNIDRNYLQCYAGGSGNNPCSSTWDFGIPVYPGLWGGPTHSSTSQVENQMNAWQNSCGIIGGFMWIYDDFDNSPDVAAYAAAINNALGPIAPPGSASNPNPADNATDISTSPSFNWTPGAGTSSHDVYFGTSPGLDASDFKGNQSGNTYTPGVLDLNTTYYWRIDEVNSSGTTTGTVWKFTTAAVNLIDHTDPPGTGVVTARAEINSNEAAIKAFDNLFSAGIQNANWSKWLDNGGVPSAVSPSWIQIQLPNAVVVNKIAIVSANDDFGRDPENFNILASNNGTSWTSLGSWTGQNWANRFERKELDITNSQSYSFYRLNITKNEQDVAMTQLCELSLIGPNVVGTNPPIADFEAIATTINVGESVSFNDLSSNSPNSWSWAFEGGTPGTSLDQTPSVTYTNPGTYDVTLTVGNNDGSDAETKSGYITVNPVGGVSYSTIPYNMDFENGGVDQYWSFDSENSFGRLQVTTQNDPNGNYHLTSDVSVNGNYSTNEALLHLDLSSDNQVNLAFVWKEFSDEDNAEDGVFFSDDGGLSYTKVYNLTGGSSNYQLVNLDIDNLVISNGLTLSNTFIIKFQHRDNYQIATDGIALDNISVTIPGPGCIDCIDFNVVALNAFANQDNDGTFAILDGGATAQLTNNTWKRTTANYAITSNSILTFEFMSNQEGEIHGIGFDEDNSISSNRIFKLFGSQNWGLNNFDNYNSQNNYISYSIPVGSFYTGAAMNLILVNDNDAGSGNNSHFRNVRIYESGAVRTASNSSEHKIINEIDDEPMAKLIGVYPNPFDSKVKLQLPVRHSFNLISMFTLTGNLIGEKIIEMEDRVIEFEFPKNLKGNLVLRLQADNVTQSFKLIRE